MTRLGSAPHTTGWLLRHLEVLFRSECGKSIGPGVVTGRHFSGDRTGIWHAGGSIKIKTREAPGACGPWALNVRMSLLLEARPTAMI